MSNIRIDTGGGGLVIGAGGVASGVGSTISVGARTENATLSRTELADFLSALGALKAALVSADVGGTTWAGKVGELEQSALGQDGRSDVESFRRLLARVRFALLGEEHVIAALAQASSRLPRSANPSDVFVSYKREDRDRVLPLVQALRSRGVDVWIDDELTPGGSFTDQICDEIDRSRTQIVCWSPLAVASDWVRGEAEMGRRRGVLVCVQIVACRIPPPFNMLHTQDLSDWRGQRDHPSWAKVLHTLSEMLGRPELGHGA